MKNKYYTTLFSLFILGNQMAIAVKVLIPTGMREALQHIAQGENSEYKERLEHVLSSQKIDLIHSKTIEKEDLHYLQQLLQDYEYYQARNKPKKQVDLIQNSRKKQCSGKKVDTLEQKPPEASEEKSSNLEQKPPEAIQEKSSNLEQEPPEAIQEKSLNLEQEPGCVNHCHKEGVPLSLKTSCIPSNPGQSTNNEDVGHKIEAAYFIEAKILEQSEAILRKSEKLLEKLEKQNSFSRDSHPESQWVSEPGVQDAQEIPWIEQALFSVEDVLISIEEDPKPELQNQPLEQKQGAEYEEKDLQNQYRAIVSAHSQELKSDPDTNENE